jgi:hypothetical protein
VVYADDVCACVCTAHFKYRYSVLAGYATVVIAGSKSNTRRMRNGACASSGSPAPAATARRRAAAMESGSERVRRGSAGRARRRGEIEHASGERGGGGGRGNCGGQLCTATWRLWALHGLNERGRHGAGTELVQIVQRGRQGEARRDACTRALGGRYEGAQQAPAQRTAREEASPAAPEDGPARPPRLRSSSQAALLRIFSHFAAWSHVSRSHVSRSLQAAESRVKIGRGSPHPDGPARRITHCASSRVSRARWRPSSPPAANLAAARPAGPRAHLVGLLEDERAQPDQGRHVVRLGRDGAAVHAVCRLPVPERACTTPRPARPPGVAARGKTERRAGQGQGQRSSRRRGCEAGLQRIRGWSGSKRSTGAGPCDRAPPVVRPQAI